MSEGRIRLDMSTEDLLVAMSDGNPDVGDLIMKLISEGSQIDPDDAMGGLATIMWLDEPLNIWGDRLMKLFRDVCGGSLIKLVALVRAYQLGRLVGITGEAINDAIDNGTTLDMPAVVAAVSEQLPNFQADPIRITPKRILPGMSVIDAILAMGGGNPGALTACVGLLKAAPLIDPEVKQFISMPIGMTYLMVMDELHIYEHRIWGLYKYVCNHDYVKMVAILRAFQLKELSAEVINHAVDNDGEGIDVDAVVATVKERVPEFNTDYTDEEPKEVPAIIGISTALRSMVAFMLLSGILVLGVGIVSELHLFQFHVGGVDIIAIAVGVVLIMGAIVTWSRSNSGPGASPGRTTA